MQKKILISLILIVLLPIALLAWLGLRTAHNEQQVLTTQVQALIDAQLVGVDESITAYFQRMQTDLIASATQLTQSNLSGDSLKNFTQHSGQVRQVLVIDADGKRIFPAPDGTLSEADKQFLQRTSAIWDNPRILTQGAGLPLISANAFASSLRKIGVSEERSSNAHGLPNKNKNATAPPQNEEENAAQYGWYAWHWNAELHHIFWWRDAKNRLIGFELSPVAVMSEIITLLPATNVTRNTPALVTSRSRLINSSGQIVYEWGNYQPKPDEKNVAMRPLSHPLGSWKLEYTAPPLAGVATANTTGILAAVLLIGIALAGLASYLYREHHREVQLAQQRVNFVNQVSHELKTPLTNIRLYAELLESEVDDIFEDVAEDERLQDGVKSRKYIGIITAESQRLSRLIANVLRFGQFQKSQPALRLQSARIDEVIRRCILAFTPALQAKDIVVRLDLQADTLVLIDTEALEQILNNLISNVEKYAALGGACHITSTQSGDASMIDVRDFGAGIAARERVRIFQPFYRVSSLLTDGVTGTGIGLDIARQLARLHGGDIVLQEVDSGACFRVTLRTEPAQEMS